MSTPQVGAQSPDAAAPKSRGSRTLAIILICCAFVATLLWAPGVMLVASNLNRSLLDAYFGQDVPQAVIDAAEGRMSVILVVSLLVVVALVVAALVVGRRTLPSTANSGLQHARWALAFLASSIAVLLEPFAAGRVIGVPYDASIAVVALIPVAMAAMVLSFILSGIALRPVAPGYETAAGSQALRRNVAAFCLVVATLLTLAVVAIVFLAARTLVSFFLNFHFVF